MTSIFYTVPGMHDVAVHSNLHYSPDSSEHLLLDAYVPAGLARNDKRPAVLLIHGGVPPGMPAKDWPIFQSWGRVLAASGLLALTFNHRLGFPKANLAQAGMDVGEAIAFARSGDADLHIDAERLALLAFSAGGPLLGAGIGKPFMRCLLAFHAILDIRQSPLHAEEGPPQLLRQYSPTAHYSDPSAAMLPIFVARAGQDMPLLNTLIDQFVANALAANAPLTLMNHPEGKHGFDSLNDDARTREIIGGAVRFMRENLEG